MKVAISLPDPLFEAAENLSRRLGLKRSQLYARALESFVKEHRGDDIRTRLEAVYANEDSQLDPLIDALQTEALREDW